MHNLNFRRLLLLAAFALLLCEVAIAQRGEPSAPQELTIEIIVPSENNANTYGARLEWEANPTEATAYNIYVKPLEEDWGGGAFQHFRTVETNEAMISADDLNIVSQAYVYFVTAINDFGESEQSNLVSSACGRPWNSGDIGQYSGSGDGEILTDPERNGHIGQKYIYDVGTFAEYSTHHQPVYELSRAPEGMTIDETTGLIQWTPEQDGVYTVVVEATTPSLNENARQVWEISIVSKVAGVEDRSLLAADLQIFPNPSAEQAILQFNATPGKEQVQIVNSQGELVELLTIETTDGTNSLSLDLNSYPVGSYLITVGENNRLTIPLRIVR